MNINYALARSIHSMVVNETLIDSHLLTDDDGYTNLFTSLINADHTNVDQLAIKSQLIEYVNNNY